MTENPYLDLEAHLDGCFQRTDISAYSQAAQGFLIHAYYILRYLMADVQKMKEDSHWHKGEDVPLPHSTFKPSVN